MKTNIFLRSDFKFHNYNFLCTLKYDGCNYAVCPGAENADEKVIYRMKWDPLFGIVLSGAGSQVIEELTPVLEYMEENDSFDGRHFEVSGKGKIALINTDEVFFGLTKYALYLHLLIMGIVAAVAAFYISVFFADIRGDFYNIHRGGYYVFKFIRLIPSAIAFLMALRLRYKDKIRTIVGAALIGLTQALVVTLVIAAFTYIPVTAAFLATVVIIAVYGLIYHLLKSKPKLNSKVFAMSLLAVCSVFAIIFGLTNTTFRFGYMPADKEKIKAAYSVALKDLDNWSGISGFQKYKDIQAIVDNEMVVDNGDKYSCSVHYYKDEDDSQAVEYPLGVGYIYMNFAVDDPNVFIPELLHSIRFTEYNIGLMDDSGFDDSGYVSEGGCGCYNLAMHESANLYTYNRIKETYGKYLDTYEPVKPETDYCVSKTSDGWEYSVHYSLSDEFEPEVTITEYNVKSNDETCTYYSENGYMSRKETEESDVTELTVPGKLNGYAVIKIENGAFEDVKDTLETLTIPASVTDIEDGTFDRCTKLTEISTGKNKHYSFRDNFLIDEETKTAMWVPRTIIGKITVPDDVKEFSSCCFSNCTYLSKILTGKNNSNFKSADGILYDNTGKLIRCPEAKQSENLKLPEECTAIGDKAFENCKSITAISIPKTVSDIGAYAFEGSSIKSLTVPKTVSRVCYAAFINATELKSVTLNSDTIYFYNTEYSSNAFSLSGTKVTSVKFAGTQEQFEKLNILLENPDSEITVHCTDGDFKYKETSGDT